MELRSNFFNAAARFRDPFSSLNRAYQLAKLCRHLREALRGLL